MKLKDFWKFSAKDIVYILIIGVIVFFGYRAFMDLQAQVEKSNIAYKQLSDTLARAQSEMVTKAELNQIATTIGVDLGKIKGDLSKLDARLRAVGETVASIEGGINSDQGSDDSIDHDPGQQPEECKLCDIHEYTASIQVKDVKIGSMPHASVEFDASREKPWTIRYDDVDVKVKTIVGEQEKENGHLVFYHTISLVNKSRPELINKEFKLKVVSSEFKENISTEKRFYWWAPHLDLNFDNNFSLSEKDLYRPGTSLGFSVCAYGRTKSDNDWRFIRIAVGINTNKNPYLLVEPARYNLGRYLPIMNDLWIGLGGFYDGGFGVSISIGTTL